MIKKFSRLRKFLCFIGFHFGSDWHITGGGKVRYGEYILDIWTGYMKCNNCSKAYRKRTEIVHEVRIK